MPGDRVKNFNDTWLASLKTDLATEVYYDAQVKGLSVRVSKAGKKTWQVFYRVKGDPTKKVKRLGEYPALKLRDARLKAGSVLADAREGLDPFAANREARKAPTVEWLASEYLEKYVSVHKRKRPAYEDERILKQDVLPRWGKRKLAGIKRRDVIALLDDVTARGVKVHANRVLAVVRKMFNWAVSRDLLDANPCSQLKAPSPERQRERVLSDAEIRAFWDACNFIQPLQAATLRLRLVTAQRGGEVLTMRWEDLDLEAGWWTIPPEIAKNKLGHRVPLSSLALSILEALTPPTDGNEKPKGWVFPSRMKAKQGAPISRTDATARKVRERMAKSLGVKLESFDFEPHDLRRTAATQMASLEVPRLVISRVLNHTEGGVTWIYDRYGYDREKREALDKWASRLAEILDHEKT